MAGFNLAKFRALPQAVQAALLSPDALERMEAIEEEFGVQLMEPLARLAIGELRWRDFSGAIAAQGVLTPVAIAVRDRVEHDLLRDVLSQMDSEAVPQRALFVEVFAAAIAAAGSLGDERRERRFRDAVESFVRNARTDGQTYDILVRSVKVGGVGLAASQADAIVAVLGPYRGRVAFPDDAPKSQDVATSSREMSVADALALTAHEERLLDHTAHRASRVSVVDAAVERVVAATGARFKQEETARRFRAALASRFRDVRDAEELRAMLIRPFAQGGLGFVPEIVRKLSIVIEREAVKLHGASSIRGVAHDSARSERELPFTPPPSLPAPTTPVLPARGVASDSSRSAREPTPTPTPTPTPQPSYGTRELPPPSLPAPRRELSLATPAPVPLSPQPVAPPRPVIARESANTRPPRGLGVNSAIPTMKEAVPTPAMTGIADPVPPPPKKEQSPPTAPKHDPIIRATSVGRIRVSSVLEAKQKIHDIRPPRSRLVGPIEELGQLTVDDFRKIAKTPADAAASIAEKLTLLDRRSHTERAQGIAALRASPLFTTYATILNTAIAEKKDVTAVITEVKTMTQEEFHALMDLNVRLRV